MQGFRRNMMSPGFGGVEETEEEAAGGVSGGQGFTPLKAILNQTQVAKMNDPRQSEQDLLDILAQQEATGAMRRQATGSRQDRIDAGLRQTAGRGQLVKNGDGVGGNDQAGSTVGPIATDPFANLAQILALNKATAQSQGATLMNNDRSNFYRNQQAGTASALQKIYDEQLEDKDLAQELMRQKIKNERKAGRQANVSSNGQKTRSGGSIMNAINNPSNNSGNNWTSIQRASSSQRGERNQQRSPHDEAIQAALKYIRINKPHLLSSL